LDALHKATAGGGRARPIYLIFRDIGLLDSVIGLLIVYHARQPDPIVCWMPFSFFKEGRERSWRGAHGRRAAEGRALPLLSRSRYRARLHLAARHHLSWNEAFWSLNLTAANARASHGVHRLVFQPEGLFWAKLSAASTMAIAPSSSSAG